MKNDVKNPLSQLTKSVVKAKRTDLKKEYYILREDVFEFVGIVTAASLPILTFVQETAEVACGV